ncbi:MAG TPA: cytochrome P450, partial [Kofleriaceae bacterium]|nr:cytochrome P450 [Kofleriaceae bacterium]
MDPGTAPVATKNQCVSIGYDHARPCDTARMEFDALPFAPGGLGLLGHNGEFRANRLAMLDRLATVDEPMMRLRVPLPGARLAVINDPALAQEMLVEKGRSFDKSDMLRFTLFPLAGEGLFTSNGELWRRQRRLMAPLFHPKALDTYAGDMVDIALRAVARWRDGESLTLLGETTRITMSVAGKTLFAADSFSDADEIGRALTVALDWTGHILGRPVAILHILARRWVERLSARAPAMTRPLFARAGLGLRGPVALFGARGRELKQAIALLDERVQRMIDERRRLGAGAPDDLLTRLLSARDDDGAAMDDRQVRDEILTLFIAGHETTATGLAWTIALLARHPAVYAAVQAEIDAVGSRPTLADLPRLSLCL